MKIRILTLLAVCAAFACVSVAPSAATASTDCTHCYQFIENPNGADVHSYPAGPVIGHVEYGIYVYVLESPEGVWCNVRFEDGPAEGNGGWILCGDL